MPSVLMVINTTGLAYDDRLRKEVGSLQALGIDVAILGVEYANRSARVSVYKDVPARTLRLRSRGWFPQGRGLAVKTAEMYLRILAHVIRSRPDTVWCHELCMSGLIPVLSALRACGWIRRVIWDHHELPSDRSLGSPLYRRLFAWLVGQCDALIMANHERRQLVLDWIGERACPPIEVLENYPDATFGDCAVEPLPDSVVRWLDGSPYLLAQGGANPDRYLDRLVAAVLREPAFKLVVVGPYLPDVPVELERTHGPSVRQRVLLTGAVPQLALAPFIDHAHASVVLYRSDSANTKLCAPNRLYQALVRNVPAVVGANPPMAELVRRLECGVVLKTDGEDANDIRDGLRQLVAAHHTLKTNCRHSRRFMWESQDAVVARVADATPLISHENSLSPARCD